ncbi:magnesium transporter NIPA-domain-containing protein [Xylariales sp. AK1849]|nr:magnesium transporter NIPA-domain-containing protein [Xylariales sp. AK1849]
MPIIPDLDDLDPWWSAVAVGDGKGNGSKLGEWSSLIGIITAIVGNVLIALALNVQRYSHIQLHKRRTEAKERAKEITRKNQKDRRSGYGTTDTNAGPAQTYGEEDGELPETRPLAQSYQSGDSGLTESSSGEGKVASTYLKSPSWWLGQVLMTIGEMGNFLAYGFAPASIVSPLGVVALISNCVIAPIFFGESFRKRDFWGVLVAIGGAVVVVLSARQEETKLDPDSVWDAITTMEFEIYLAISITLIVVLMWASPKYGNRTILIDIGLVGLFGAYTVLATKGVSSMLSSTLWRAFARPVTYVLILILLGTAVMQVRYVNKALQRFDSTQVIPIQFVMFTLSVIIGSAVLYRDFERTTTEQAVKFIGGCLLTFFGVFLVTSGRARHDDEDGLSDDEDIEETIGLTDQEASSADGIKPSEDQRQQESAQTSRRSSRVSFAVRPANVTRDSGVPSLRRPDASISRTSLPSRHSPAEQSPLLMNPWDQPSHPGLPSAFSDDSVVTIQSMTSANTDPLPTDTSLPPTMVAPPSPTTTRPVTPRPSFSSSRPRSQHLTNTIISPSPLSSTVSAVVGDKLLRSEDGTLLRRKSSRRMRPSIRSSLFVSSDDVEQHESEALLRPTETEPVLGQAGGPNDRSRSFHGRARSLSNTLGEFFGRKRGRRNTNPEAGLSQDSQSSGLTDESGNGGAQS